MKLWKQNLRSYSYVFKTGLYVQATLNCLLPFKYFPLCLRFQQMSLIKSLKIFFKVSLSSFKWHVVERESKICRIRRSLKKKDTKKESKADSPLHNFGFGALWVQYGKLLELQKKIFSLCGCTYPWNLYSLSDLCQFSSGSNFWRKFKRTNFSLSILPPTKGGCGMTANKDPHWKAFPPKRSSPGAGGRNIFHCCHSQPFSALWGSEVVTTPQLSVQQMRNKAAPTLLPEFCAGPLVPILI